MGCCSDSCCDWVFLAGPDMQTLTVAKRNPNTCIFESIGNIECWQSLIKMTLAFGAIHLPILTPHRKCTMQSYYNDLALINPSNGGRGPMGRLFCSREYLVYSNSPETYYTHRYSQHYRFQNSSAFMESKSLDQCRHPIQENIQNLETASLCTCCNTQGDNAETVKQ